MQTSRLYLSNPSNDTGLSLIRALVRAENKSTQFPDVLGDLHERGSLRILVAREPAHHGEPILYRLEQLHRAIQRARRKLEEYDDNPWGLRYSQQLRDQLQEQRTKDRANLIALQDSFWELNVKDPTERARTRLTEELGYEKWKNSKRTFLANLNRPEAAGVTSQVHAPEIVPEPQVSVAPVLRESRQSVV